MSNCIDIVRGGEVTFFFDEIDIPAFKSLVASSRDVGFGNMTPEEVKIYYAWWFLDHAEVTDASVTIRFGHGRSGHTNRDFKGTIKVLSGFMKKKKFHTFFITDEFDGHKQVFKWSLDFKSLVGLG